MSLRAGAAVEEITPSGSVPLFGYPRQKRMSSGVNDPLYVSALHLRSGSTALVLLTVDIFGLDPLMVQSIRRTIARQIGVREECIFLSCTHNHSGPVTLQHLAWQGDPAVPRPDNAYMDFLKSRILAASAKASASTRPAEIAWTSVEPDGIGGNRTSPDGITDPEAGVMCVREAGGGRVFALLIAYGMHPTILHETSTLISADFPGYTRRNLKEKLGDPLVVLYCNGPCADQSPRHFATEHTVAEAERVGRRLGECVLTGISDMPPEAYTADPALSADFAIATLPTPRKLPTLWDAKVFWGECRAHYDRIRTENAAEPQLRTARANVLGSESTMGLVRARERGQIDDIMPYYGAVEIQRLQIGDAYLLGIPGEMAAEYGLRIKRSAEKRTFIVNFVNGDLQGYIVTPDVEESGLYESLNALFPAEAGRSLVQAALSLVGPERGQAPRHTKLRPDLEKLRDSIEEQRSEQTAAELREKELTDTKVKPPVKFSWLG